LRFQGAVAGHFAGHDEGGIAWGRIASLIETCKVNGVEPPSPISRPP
jgi:hypothetical protein